MSEVTSRQGCALGNTTCNGDLLRSSLTPLQHHGTHLLCNSLRDSLRSLQEARKLQFEEAHSKVETAHQLATNERTRLATAGTGIKADIKYEKEGLVKKDKESASDKKAHEGKLKALDAEHER